MRKRIFGDYVQDILDAIMDTSDFTTGMKFENFVEDRKTISAVIRCLEVIGEAAKKMPDEIKDEHPDIPWKSMAGMRDKLIHEYFGVDLEIVWEVIRNDLPPIVPLIRKVLDNIESEL